MKIRAELIARTAIWLAALAAVLLLAAGTPRWPAAWLYLAELGGCSLASGLWLAKHDPALLAERLRPPIQRRQERQERWDKLFIAAALIVWLAWLVLITLDAERYRWSALPLWLRIAGALGLLLSMALVHRTFQENKFTAPVVAIQTERGHRVVATGPYRLVRHPLYAGAVLNFFATPLMLGSWLGLAATPLLIAGLAVRAVLEERTLSAKLAGYAAYRQSVRYRLIPGVW